MHKNLMRALAFCGAIALSLPPLLARAADPAKATLKVAFVYVSRWARPAGATSTTWAGARCCAHWTAR